MGGDHLWDAVAAIGQAVSALALVFVLVQVRHAREEMRRSTSQSRADASRELFMLRAATPRLIEALNRTDAGLGQTSLMASMLAEKGGVPIEDAAQVFSYLMAWWIYHSQLIPHVQEMRPGERAQFDSGIRGIYGLSAAGGFWFESVKGRFDPEAVRYVDNLLAHPN